jgi:hypothetical protein
MNKLNNIVVILLKDGRKMCLDIGNPMSAQKAAIDFLIQEGIAHTLIKKIISVPETQYTAFEYQYYFDEITGVMDKKSILIDKKIEEIKKRRSLFFNKLDLEFMKALEDDSPERKNHIVVMKNYIRTLPDLLDECLPDLSEEEISGFNEYNNIFKIFLLSGGQGYTKSPKVIIDPPKGAGTAGFQLKATATVKDGKVNELIITQYGSGYLNIPKIEFSEPDEEGKEAFAIASDPENDIFQLSHRWDPRTI